MLYYVATRRNLYTMRKHLRHFGRELRDVVRLRSYEHLLSARKMPSSAYIFSDVERLDPSEIKRASHVRRALVSAGCTVLNDPVRSMRRYELLRTMHDLGINVSNVYRVTENRQPVRYPVFVRGENDHAGAQSPLLHSLVELQAAIENFAGQGIAREQLLITEFCDTKDNQGVYRKYSAFVVAGQVIPRHLFFGKSWMLKVPELFDDAHLCEEIRFLNTNPHADQLRRIFAAARIDYGRIDYGIEAGAVRVWEINTNPMITTPADATFASRLRVQEQFAPAFNQVLQSLAMGRHASDTVRIPPGSRMSARSPILHRLTSLWRRAG